MISAISALSGFIRDEQGQDLIEYTLLLAFVCLGSAVRVRNHRRQRTAGWRQHFGQLRIRQGFVLRPRSRTTASRQC
jgi:hypothetical protein